jgi:hypothetical protein
MRLYLALAFATLLSATGHAADKPAAFDHHAASVPAACATADQPRLQVAQLACCKAHKGVCGCRAGKIVCCDGSTSNEPGCTCHGDEGIVE